MSRNIKKIVANNFLNFPGFRTTRKIVVLESDDWGSIRMPSNSVYDALKSAGIPVDRSPYCKFDNLESNDDMQNLLELLSSFKDFKGNHPIMTANTVVANPDFAKIKANSYQEYYYEPFTETLKKYPKHDKVYDLYNQGISQKLIFPQFHGREHVNVELWLEKLKSNKNFQLAFTHKMWGLSNDVFPQEKSVQATFDSNNDCFLAESAREGLHMFKNLFRYESESFIANNFIWSLALEETLAENGVKHLQGMKYQKLPKVDEQPSKLIRHYLGEKNIHNQIYSVRNCYFEPTIDGGGYEKTLKEIQNAFFWNKPAIISTHRINFIGSLNENNRKVNSDNFKLLLKIILNKWPDIEFMTTMDLDKLIREK